MRTGGLFKVVVTTRFASDMEYGLSYRSTHISSVHAIGYPAVHYRLKEAISYCQNELSRWVSVFITNIISPEVGVPERDKKTMRTNDISRRSVLKQSAVAGGLLTLGGIAASGTAAAEIGDGRVVDFHLNNLNYDRDRGTVVAGHVHDSSPYDNHGEWLNSLENGTPVYSDDEPSPVVKDSPVGNGYTFDGTDDHLNVPDNSSLDLQDELTIAFWFRLDGESGDNAFPRAVSKGQSTTANGAYGVFIEDPSRDADRIGLRFIDSTGGRNDVDKTGLPYNDGMWHHVAATYSNDADVGRLYFDNTEVASSTITGDVQIRTTDDDLHVGDGNGERHFNGGLDEVRVYNRALTASEVAELYGMADD